MSWVDTTVEARSLPNVLASHSLNGEAMHAHIGLYHTIMYGDSPLSRSEREAIAVAVSAANSCHY
jgi:alkylhydroperoxidase family enzyme